MQFIKSSLNKKLNLKLKSFYWYFLLNLSKILFIEAVTNFWFISSNYQMELFNKNRYGADYDKWVTLVCTNAVCLHYSVCVSIYSNKWQYRYYNKKYCIFVICIISNGGKLIGWSCSFLPRTSKNILLLPFLQLTIPAFKK